MNPEYTIVTDYDATKLCKKVEIEMRERKMIPAGGPVVLPDGKGSVYILQALYRA